MLNAFSICYLLVTISCYSVGYTLLRLRKKDYFVFYFIVAYVYYLRGFVLIWVVSVGWKVIPADTLYWDKKTE